jgi:hypothetical protein
VSTITSLTTIVTIVSTLAVVAILHLAFLIIRWVLRRKTAGRWKFWRRKSTPEQAAEEEPLLSERHDVAHTDP